jgi:hypothetical protein
VNKITALFLQVFGAVYSTFIGIAVFLVVTNAGLNVFPLTPCPELEYVPPGISVMVVIVSIGESSQN